MPTVRADVVGEGVHELALDADATYGDLLAALSFSPHEATVLVDDTPVPEDRVVDADRVRVLRLVKGGAGADAVTVRPATADDHLDAVRVLDGAMLETGDVRERIADGEVTVATVDGRVVGVLVREGTHVESVAVRRRRRDAGVGTALVEAALAACGSLTADFDASVRPFYESLGFSVERVGDGRFRGRLDACRRS